MQVISATPATLEAGCMSLSLPLRADCVCPCPCCTAGAGGVAYQQAVAEVAYQQGVGGVAYQQGLRPEKVTQIGPMGGPGPAHNPSGMPPAALVTLGK